MLAVALCLLCCFISIAYFVAPLLFYCTRLLMLLLLFSIAYFAARVEKAFNLSHIAISVNKLHCAKSVCDLGKKNFSYT